MAGSIWSDGRASGRLGKLDTMAVDGRTYCDRSRSDSRALSLRSRLLLRYRGCDASEMELGGRAGIECTANEQQGQETEITCPRLPESNIEFADQSLCLPIFFFMSGANSPMLLIITPTHACVITL